MIAFFKNLKLGDYLFDEVGVDLVMRAVVMDILDLCRSGGTALKKRGIM